MFQDVVIATGRHLTLELPAELVGKRLRVLAFEENEGQLPLAPPTAVTELNAGELHAEAKARRIVEIQAITASHRVDLSGFKFDRDWANDYNAE